jgi:hypothetical protein
MTNLMYERLARIVFYSDLHGTRFLLGVAELLWFVTLLMPGDTFSRPTYLIMSHVMSEEAWAFLFAMSGITQLTIVFTNNYDSKFAVTFAGWNSVLWWYVVLSMYLSVAPPPAAISGETALAIGAAWVFIRSGFPCKGRRTTDYGN